MIQNFSSLPEHIFKKGTSVATTPHKEAEPLLVETRVPAEIVEEAVEEQVEAQPTQNVATQVSIVPEKPQITKEQEDLGVTTSSASIFVQGKKINMPLSAPDFELDLHKPFTTGARWMAEIVRYLLQKFHVTVRKISGIFQFVNQ